MIDIVHKTVLGKYRIENPIGSGGFARVYRATQIGPGGFSKNVAVKVLRRQHGDNVEHFLREARILGLLNHRNIVHVHEFVEQEGSYFLVMEYVEGVTLSRLSHELGAVIAIWLKLSIGVDVCRALRFAHTLRDQKNQINGVIHRDIKPSNILISQQGDVKVADFGLAKKSFGDSLTQLGQIKGTPRFMSPEQRQGSPTTVKSDVYSLASVLHDLCTNGSAKQSDRLLPEALSVIDHGLHPDPEQRPDSTMFGMQLQELLEKVAPTGRLSHVADELSGYVQRCSTGPTPHEVSTASISDRKGAAFDFAPRIARKESPTKPAPVPADDARRRNPLATTNVYLAPSASRSESGTRPTSWWSLSRGLAFAGLMVLAILSVVIIGNQSDDTKDRANHDDAGLVAYQPNDRVDSGDSSTIISDVSVTISPLDLQIEQEQAVVQRVVAGRDKTNARSKRTRRRRPGIKHSKREKRVLATGVGFLSVNAEPWATVYVDNKNVGVTPIYRMPLTAGLHTITLRSQKGRQVAKRLRIRTTVHENLGLVLLK